MQTLWTRALSSSRSCRCYSCVNSGPRAVSGRNPASRRRLLLGNGVTMFYSSIFATAAVLDATSKKKRQRERDKEIESVKAEVQELQNEEARLLAHLALRRRSCAALPTSQRRQYSTSSAANTSPLDEKFQTAAGPRAEGSRVPNSRLLQQHMAATSESDLGPNNSSINDDPWMETSLDPKPGTDRRRAIQALAMKQLALRLLLRPNIAHSYGSVHMDHPVDFRIPKMDVEKLLDELSVNRKRILELRQSIRAPYHDLVEPVNLEQHSQLLEDRKKLEEELHDIFALYYEDMISLREMVLRVADNLVASKEPILPTTLPLLIGGFSRAKQYDVVLLVMNSLFPNGFPLTSYAISVSINFFASTNDLSSFNRFLHRLQDRNSSLNRKPWKTVRVFDVMVPVPQDPAHPFVMTSLIKAALRFEQPHKANAWLEYFKGKGHKENTAILQAYLRYYSLMEDWQKGAHFLLKSARHLISTQPHDPKYTERLILHMMTLCNCCRREELCSTIIRSAVTSGIDWNLSHVDNDNWEGVLYSTLQQWKQESESAAAGNLLVDKPPSGETKYAVFGSEIQSAVIEEMKEIWAKKNLGKRAEELRTEVERDENASPTIKDLRNQVADLKKMLADVLQSQRRHEPRRRSTARGRVEVQNSRSSRFHGHEYTISGNDDRDETANSTPVSGAGKINLEFYPSKKISTSSNSLPHYPSKAEVKKPQGTDRHQEAPKSTPVMMAFPAPPNDTFL